MKRVHLSLVFHNHQPVGNFDFVFQQAYDTSYLPLVECLERHPSIRAALHFTGCLRDWLLVHQPGLYDRVGELVNRGQVEILGGAYYEPILVMLTDEDKIGQMDKLSDAILADFGVRPEGMWLAERIWEPHLAKPIAQANLRYAIIDDTHFTYSGFNDDEMFGYYVTEEQNHPLRLLPALKQMRYLLPWGDIDDVMAYLWGIFSSPTTPEQALVVMGDDGEKFGLWPGTYAHCWEGGYMDALFTALAAANDWLETTLPGSYVDQFPALGRAYIPTASYIEMTEWALPAERTAEIISVRRNVELALEAAQGDPIRQDYLRGILRYMRGGFWRNFMVKYPEANHMQKRAMYTSQRAHQLPDGPEKERALSHLWAAQCNCGYWHGLFGGIYLFHIRAANYANLLEAEAIILDDRVHVDYVDFNADSRYELMVNSQPFCFVIDLAHGGALLEWDDIPSRYNLLNIMTRRYEGYHERLKIEAAEGDIIDPDDPEWKNTDTMGAGSSRVKEPGLEALLFVDWHRRGSLIDHFISPATTPERFAHVQYGEQGDFVDKPYSVEVNGSGDQRAVIVLSRDGHVWVDGVHQPVRVMKQLTIENGARRLEVDYTITNQARVSLQMRFGLEMCFGFDGGDSEFCYFRLPDDDAPASMGETTSSSGVSEYALGTRIRGFEVRARPGMTGELWRFPLEPVTISEAGFERIHQGAVFLHVYPLALKPGESWREKLIFELVDLPAT